jgi:hypothetical protein
MRRRDVGSWHLADVPACPPNVPLSRVGDSGHARPRRAKRDEWQPATIASQNSAAHLHRRVSHCNCFARITTEHICYRSAASGAMAHGTRRRRPSPSKQRSLGGARRGSNEPRLCRRASPRCPLSACRPNRTWPHRRATWPFTRSGPPPIDQGAERHRSSGVFPWAWNGSDNASPSSPSRGRPGAKEEKTCRSKTT